MPGGEMDTSESLQVSSTLLINARQHVHETSERLAKGVQKGRPEAVAIAHPDLLPVGQRSLIGAQGLCICMIKDR